MSTLITNGTIVTAEGTQQDRVVTAKHSSISSAPSRQRRSRCVASLHGCRFPGVDYARTYARDHGKVAATSVEINRRFFSSARDMVKWKCAMAAG